MGLFTNWVPASGLVIDLAGEMEGGAVAYAVVDLDAGQRVKVRLPKGGGAVVSRGDRIRFLHAPEKRTKPVKQLEVLPREGA